MPTFVVPEELRRHLGLEPHGSDATDSVRWASISCLGAYRGHYSPRKDLRNHGV